MTITMTPRKQDLDATKTDANMNSDIVAAHTRSTQDQDKCPTLRRGSGQ